MGQRPPLRVTPTYIGLGSNLGDARATLAGAVAALADLGEVASVSALYETDPVGYLDQPPFLNAAARLDTVLEPLELLDALLAIEARFGRERSVRFGPRTLDLDLLVYPGADCESERLTLPHPRLAEREFALRPLADLDPGLDVGGVTVAELLRALAPQGVRPAGTL
jgi:2-amino-4-hydroxy-6-hydroxymethyldihydropteridine diphosphokinase